MIQHNSHSDIYQNQMQPLLADPDDISQIKKESMNPVETKIQQENLKKDLEFTPSSKIDFAAVQLSPNESKQVLLLSDIAATKFESIDNESLEKQITILNSTVSTLPEDLKDLPEGFTEIPIALIKQAANTQIKEVSPVSGKVSDGKEYFEEVLKELDRVKDKLGGSPHFPKGKPSLEDQDASKTFLGFPLSAVKDWLRMTLKKEWTPALFWKTVAELFGVTAENSPTKYEQAHICIQRFGLLIANKEYFFNLLEETAITEDYSRLSDFGKITGLAWHPKDNGIGTEKIYIEFVEKFLTEDFEAAKKKGDESLAEYFQAFEGVCFEDRCRHLEKFATEHPTDEGIKEVMADLDKIIDIDFNKSAENAFNAIAATVADLSPPNLLAELRKHDIFNKEFPTDNKEKAKPNLQDFQDYILKMVDAYVVNPYESEEDLLQVELEILKNSGQEINAANFRIQLQKLDGKEIIGEDRSAFSTSDPRVDKFINAHFLE